MSAETVHESERSRIIRLLLAESPVVRKESLEPGSAHRVRHEAAMLLRPRGIGEWRNWLTRPTISAPSC
jgi:hypothetical protein